MAPQVEGISQCNITVVQSRWKFHEPKETLKGSLFFQGQERGVMPLGKQRNQSHSSGTAVKEWVEQQAGNSPHKAQHAGNQKEPTR